MYSHGKLYQMMLVVLEELCPKARLIVCTDGENGSFLLKRPSDTLTDMRSRNIHNIVSEDTVHCIFAFDMHYAAGLGAMLTFGCSDRQVHLQDPGKQRFRGGK